MASSRGCFGKLSRAYYASLFVQSRAKCIRAEKGNLRDFTGDSVLAFFIGKDNQQAISAVRAAMKTQYAIHYIVNPLLNDKYGSSAIIEFGSGVAQGMIVAAKSGIRGDPHNQDLVWIGSPVYDAVRYGEEAHGRYPIWISSDVHSSIAGYRKMTHTSNGDPAWFKHELEDSGWDEPEYAFKTAKKWSV